MSATEKPGARPRKRRQASSPWTTDELYRGAEALRDELQRALALGNAVPDNFYIRRGARLPEIFHTVERWMDIRGEQLASSLIGIATRFVLRSGRLRSDGYNVDELERLVGDARKETERFKLTEGGKRKIRAIVFRKGGRQRRLAVTLSGKIYRVYEIISKGALCSPRYDQRHNAPRGKLKKMIDLHIALNLRALKADPQLRREAKHQLPTVRGTIRISKSELRDLGVDL